MTMEIFLFFLSSFTDFFFKIELRISIATGKLELEVVTLNIKGKMHGKFEQNKNRWYFDPPKKN